MEAMQTVPQMTITETHYYPEGTKLTSTIAFEIQLSLKDPFKYTNPCWNNIMEETK